MSFISTNNRPDSMSNLMAPSNTSAEILEHAIKRALITEEGVPALQLDRYSPAGLWNWLLKQDGRIEAFLTLGNVKKDGYESGDGGSSGKETKEKDMCEDKETSEDKEMCEFDFSERIRMYYRTPELVLLARPAM